MKNDPYKLLLITSSAGGGLLKAADAQEQTALLENPKVQIFKHDVLREWVWSWLGNFSIRSWNEAQKKGCVRSQAFFVSFHWLFDYLTWPTVFWNTFKVLRKEKIDRVIDTQTTSTNAIMKAIRSFNWLYSKHVFLEKVVVDLPTKKAQHFFRPIKAFSKKDKSYLKLRTIKPLLEKDQSSDAFWQVHCGLSESEVYYEDVNVRTPFQLLKGKNRSEEDTSSFTLSFKSETERHFMEECGSKGSLSYTVNKEKISFSVPKEAFVVTVLLGSQPAGPSTLRYLQHGVEIAKIINKPIVLFVFCGEYHDSKNCLFHKVVDFVKSAQDYPKNLTVVPFTFQKDEAIAPLFHRSDITCSRSGGQTAMELMAVSTGQIWIHSEAKTENLNPSLKELLKGIPKWESESAKYLYELYGAKVVTPTMFKDLLFKTLKSV